VSKKYFFDLFPLISSRNISYIPSICGLIIQPLIFHLWCTLLFSSMFPLSSRAAHAQSLLAAYAVPVISTLGRTYEEASDETRFPFQRDRDRILHTQAFRRLKHKTQVFVSGYGDHYRTRITHTLEVAQVSRDLARTLGLNEDLAECIALAHDLGHTPFGHAGEEAMDQCMHAFGKTFEHNEQSLRVVNVLEDRSSHYRGLNLNQEVLEGLQKHRTPHDHPAATRSRAPSLEAQVVNLADEIAYTAHDTDDGLRARLFSLDDLRVTALGRLALQRTHMSGGEARGAIVDILVTDLYAETDARIRTHNLRSLEDVYAARESVVAFSSPLAAQLKEHREFLWEKLYRSPSVVLQAAEGKRVITELFDRYIKEQPPKVQELIKRTSSNTEEAVKDFIAGMTDRYATEQLTTHLSSRPLR
jgi:dGTPase